MSIRGRHRDPRRYNSRGEFIFPIEWTLFNNNLFLADPNNLNNVNLTKKGTESGVFLAGLTDADLLATGGVDDAIWDLDGNNVNLKAV